MWKAKKIGGWETGEGTSIWTDQKVYLVEWMSSQRWELGYRIVDDRGEVERLTIEDYEAEWETVAWATPLGLFETEQLY